MFKTFVNAWKIPEIRKKILFTALILFIFRVGAAIPVPFIDVGEGGIFDFTNGSSMQGTFMEYLTMMTGNAFNYGTLFAMSITPYINSSIIMQLLTVAIPALERLSKDGEEGRKKIASITRFVTIALGLLQSTAYYFYLRGNNYLLNSTDGVAFKGFDAILQALVIIACLTAGTALIMWLGEQINVNGIGNGISLILFAGIVSRIPTLITQLYSSNGGYFSRGGVYAVLTVAVSIVLLLMIAYIVWMDNAERRIPVQYAKRVVGRKMYGGQSSHIPLKVNQAGVIPVIFAVSLLQIPMTIAYMTGTDSGFYKFVYKYLSSSGNPGTYIYFIFNILLIIAFTYFYGQISLNPTEIADNLKNNGGYVPGIRPGKPTVEHISKVASRLTIVSAIFLAIVASIPTLVSALTGASAGFGGTSLIIAIGVALDTQRAIETQLVMRNYSGFLK